MIKISEGFFEKYGVGSRMGSLSSIGESEREILTPQQQHDGYRLVCQARLHGDVVVFAPEESQMGKPIVLARCRSPRASTTP
jgi:uncharacterized 2Fe-2S/4Fe-4S cluster protein (DUF4445 family)